MCRRFAARGGAGVRAAHWRGLAGRPVPAGRDLPQGVRPGALPAPGVGLARGHRARAYRGGARHGAPGGPIPCHLSRVPAPVNQNPYSHHRPCCGCCPAVRLAQGEAPAVTARRVPYALIPDIIFPLCLCSGPRRWKIWALQGWPRAHQVIPPSTLPSHHRPTKWYYAVGMLLGAKGARR